MVRESICEIKNGKASEASFAVSDIVKTVGEARVDLTFDLVHEITVGVIAT